MSFLFSKKPKKNPTRMFFATDLHGSERTFRKFINAGKFYDVNVIVMGGDIQGKLMIPIIKEGNGHHRATVQGRVEHLETEEELKALMGKLDILGFYHKVMEQDEFLALQANPDDVHSLFNELAKQKLINWVSLAEERLNGTGIKCFVTGGNDDEWEVLNVMKQQPTKSFFACENEMVHVDEDHTMISVGISTPTPWKTPREVPEEELGAMIDKMAALVPDMSKAIFNFHDPPKDFDPGYLSHVGLGQGSPGTNHQRRSTHYARSRLERGQRRDRKVQADARVAWSYPRVAVRCEDWTHDHHQSR